MIQLHCGVNQMKIGKSMGVLHSFVWNFVKYANMEGFHRDSHIYTSHSFPFNSYLKQLYICEHFCYNNGYGVIHAKAFKGRATVRS